MNEQDYLADVQVRRHMDGARLYFKVGALRFTLSLDEAGARELAAGLLVTRRGDSEIACVVDIAPLQLPDGFDEVNAKTLNCRPKMKYGSEL